MNVTTWDQWEQWRGTYANVPFVREIEWTKGRPATWEPFRLHASEEPSFIMESAKGGRYSYYGNTPVATIKGKGNDARIATYVRRNDAGGNMAVHIEERRETGTPLQVVKAWLAPYRAPRLEHVPPFIGGCVGLWSYDIARSIERLPVVAEDDLQIPDYDLMVMERIWIIDHEEQKLYCAVHKRIAPPAASEITADNVPDVRQLYEQAEQETSRMVEQWHDWFEQAETSAAALQRRAVYERISRDQELHIDVERIPGIEIAFSRPRFMAAVEKIQQYIAQGDVFQVNLSVRQSKPLQTSAEDIYEWLRMLNPSPYMGLLRFDGYELVSGSPELLVKTANGRVETRPIAGTRPRGANREADEQLASELITNEKERAEHIMLVDLLRNDLGRVSRYGTVKVTELMAIEYYSHVMHIVSHVVGELADGKDAFDVIAGIFPGGTITGAPKIRTMEIVEELEPVRRGPYTGSIGWIDYNGDMELNIIIRTLLVKDGVGYVQSGAGIVIDSKPENEFVESLNKAKALWKAIQYSENRGAERG